MASYPAWWLAGWLASRYFTVYSQSLHADVLGFFLQQRQAAVAVAPCVFRGREPWGPPMGPEEQL